MRNINIEPIEILLVEDNPGDVELIMMAFEESKLKNNINIVDDGQKAVDYVYKRNEYSNAKTPDIILLDINLPILNGFEVLEIIKNDQQLKSIPVLILTTSNTDKDVLKAYKKHANAYLNKPIDFNEFVEIIKSIENFWFTLVKLPSNEV